MWLFGLESLSRLLALPSHIRMNFVINNGMIYHNFGSAPGMSTTRRGGSAPEMDWTIELTMFNHGPGLCRYPDPPLPFTMR
jgi:hypothetical protein